MKRSALVLLALVLVMGFGVATDSRLARDVPVGYGKVVSEYVELNDSVPLIVEITEISEHVGQIYVDVSDGLMENVYCAPGAREKSTDEEDKWDARFVCIALPGQYEGRLTFRPSNIEEGEDGEDTVVRLTVRQKDVWYTHYGSTNVGGVITVGQYRIEVEDVEPITAEVSVYKGSSPVWGGLVFIGQDVEVSDEFVFKFNGYSEKRGIAFFTFKTRFVASVASSVEDYYLVATPKVYVGENNYASATVVTNCSRVKLCTDGNCSEHTVTGDALTLHLRPGTHSVECVGRDLSDTIVVDVPKTITKTVEKEVEPSKICPSWFYGLSPTAKSSYCSTTCGASTSGMTGTSAQPPDSDLAKWAGLAVILAVVGYFIWRKYQDGEIGGKKSKMQFEEIDKEIEAVPDVEG